MTAEMRHPKLAITMGDPAGIGPEIIIRSLSRPDIYEHCTPIVLGDEGVLRKVQREMGGSVIFNPIQSPDQAQDKTANLIPLSNINLDQFEYGQPRTDLGLVSTFYIVKAAEMTVSNQVDALVTCPINKAMLHEAGYDHHSHTDLLKSITKTKHSATLIASDHLRVARVTSHVPIREVPNLICKERVYNAIALTYKALETSFKIKRPRLAVVGLNPHASENGLFGMEETEHIMPAVTEARNQGMRVTGPLPVEHAFLRARDEEFDAVIIMYHDQGAIAHRLIDNSFGVTITLGLPIIRTSPNHGTAYDIAGKGYASEKSLFSAIIQAAAFAADRIKQQSQSS